MMAGAPGSALHKSTNKECGMKGYLVLDDVVLIGRTAAEYDQFFGFAEAGLGRGPILDVGAGVSSFCAERTAQDFDVIAFDPIYGAPPETIRCRCEADLERVMAQMPAISHHYRWDYYQNLDTLKSYRIKAYESFLAHYCQDQSRYLAGTLPDTGFADHSFALALVSHFLFLYDQQLDYPFHKESLLELCRIAEEVRIYPLVTFNGARSPWLNLLLQDRDCSKLAFRIEPSGFAFMKQAHERLVVRRAVVAKPGVRP